MKRGISLSETIWQRVLNEVQKELNINKKISKNTFNHNCYKTCG